MTDVKLERNIAITSRFLNGERITSLAREYNLSTERARQIVRSYCRKANKQWYAAMPPGPPWPDFEWLRQHRQVFLEDMSKLVPNVEGNRLAANEPTKER